MFCISLLCGLRSIPLYRPSQRGKRMRTENDLYSNKKQKHLQPLFHQDPEVGLDNIFSLLSFIQQYYLYSYTVQ